MRELFNGIFTWGSVYPDRPWDLNGYALKLDGATLLLDPPQPEAAEWPNLDALQPIGKIILTNRDHTRDAEAFRARFHASVAACVDELSQFASLKIDETFRDGDLLWGGLRVIHLPGKSPGEVGFYIEPAHHKGALAAGGIMLLGDALIGHPPGQLGLIPPAKLDNPALLKQSLRKLLNYDFQVLLLCDGQPVLSHAKSKVAAFLADLSESQVA
jgi:glyoxylase-like metal-dependent hydrolase (beta-lactamase superfamily II)